MKKFAKYLWSWTFPAVVLFLVILGNWSSADAADAGVMCPPKRPADGGMCDPKKVEEDTPPIPAPTDAGTKIEKKKVKIQFKGRELDFVPTGSGDVKWLTDAGTKAKKPEWLTDRRATLLLQAKSIADSMSLKLDREITIHNIYVADGFSEKADAAVVVYADERPLRDGGTEHQEMALVFLFSDKQWRVLPTDLSELGPDSL